jgi:hypothetical protein
LEGTIGRRRTNLRNEILRIDTVATTKMPRNHEFGMTLNSNERVGIADARIVCLVGPLVAFLLLHESPDFVEL